MPLSEFDIIAEYFERAGLASPPGNPAVPLGIGDDCALLDTPAGKQLAVTLDMLVEGVHFPRGAAPFLVAHKALAANLSDLAAMGAQPCAFTLGLCLPETDAEWLRGFSEGLLALAARCACPLIGGDITRGPLCIAIQAHGFLPRGAALRRDGAQTGDLVLVTGTLGDAGLGLRLALGGDDGLALGDEERLVLERAYHLPEPRLAFGRALLGLASAAIDVSDGLMADLGHIARRSGRKIRLRAAHLPLSPSLEKTLGREAATRLALGAGDDYELAFCLPPNRLGALRERARDLDLPFTCVGEVLEGEGIECVDAAGGALAPPRQGYRHF